MAMNIRTWSEWNDLHPPLGPLVLIVDDGTLAHQTELESAAEVEAALDDYAAGYDSDPGDAIEVAWSLWHGGEEIKDGRKEFVVR